MLAARATYSTGSGSNPSFVAATDLDGDSAADIIVANYGTNDIGVFLNTGNGTFTGQTTYSTGSSSYCVTAADLNDDGKPDIIVANYGANNIGVLLNTGNGAFTGQTTYSTGPSSGPLFVVTVDVNGDNQTDVIVANYDADNVGVLLNEGNGTLTPQVTYFSGSGSKPSSLVAADIDGDKIPDLIVSNYGAHDVGVFLNTGNGTFTDQAIYWTGSNSYCVAAADINDDGKIDIVVANYGANNIGVLLNTGNGTFTGQTTYSTGPSSGPLFVVTVDVNSDNKLDFVTANYGTNSVAVLLNTGNGTFTSQTTYSTGPSSNPYSLAAADVNGDNKTDIIVSNYGANNVGVLLANC